MQEEKLAPDYDVLAKSLMQCISNGENETQKDNSLGIFLSKVYKNNTAPKPKRMNSIRLSRFNAFLYRMNSPYPTDVLTNNIIQLSLIAMLNNSRNFEEEEDQQIIMSIAKWCCTLIQNTALVGLHDVAFCVLGYLLGEMRADESILISLDHFQSLVKDCAFLSNIELSAQDEKNAYFQRGNPNISLSTINAVGSNSLQRPSFDFASLDGQKKEKYTLWELSNFNITIPFSFNLFILRNIQLVPIYTQLFKGLNSLEKRRNLLKLFAKHTATVHPLRQPKIDVFIKTFLNDPKLVSPSLSVLLQFLDKENFGYESILVAKQRIFDLGFQLSDVLSMQFNGSETEQLFLESLQQKYKNNGLDSIIKTFLSCNTANLIAPCLIANSQELISHQYLALLFRQQELTQRHSIILAFLVAQNLGSNFHQKILKAWLQCALELDPLKTSHLVKMLFMSLSDPDKNSCYAKICATLDSVKINKAGQLATFATGQINSSRLTEQSRCILCQLLIKSNKLAQECLPLKIELLGICGENLAMTKRIKDLNSLFQLPIQQILKRLLTIDHLNRDPILFAAALMGLNNKLEVVFIEDPEDLSLKFLSSQFMTFDYNFGKKLAEYCHQKHISPYGNYLATLAKYNIQCETALGNFPEPLASLLSGKVKYNRLVQTDFSGYYYKEESTSEVLDQLWIQKKLLLESRILLKKLFRKQKASSQLVKEVKGLLDPQWAFPLGFKLIQAYFEADINDPQILRHVLSKTPPQFGFFDRVCSVFHSQSQDNIDFTMYLHKLLRAIYPQTIAFFARLLDSQAVVRKQKDKKKSKKKRQKNPLSSDQSPPNLDLPALFQFFKKEKAFGTLFGDPNLLQTFDQVFKIITKLPITEIPSLSSLIQQWLQTFCIFHPQADKLKWRTKVLSYCRIWRVLFIQLKLQLRTQILSKHCDILTELLSMHYESKSQFPELQQQLLITLLLVLQGSQSGTMLDVQTVPIQSIKNCLIGFKLPVPCEQHFFTCYTCNLTVCQVCAPFLHKHHDLNFLGKEGSCVHDSSQKKLNPPPQRNPVPGQGRPQRRQEDLFPINFDLGDEEMDFNEHIRFRQLMEYRLREQQRDRDREYQSMRERMDRQRARQQRELFMRQSRNRQKDDIVEESNKNLVVEEEQRQEVINEIKSDGSKSIRNIQKGHKSSFALVPEFTPMDQTQAPYISKIDAKPLTHILIREMQIALGQLNQQGLSKAQVSKERYNFFKQSAYFKAARSEYGNIMRGGFGGSTIPVKRNLLTSNRKFLAFPSSSNGILLLSLTVIGMKLQRRQHTKSMGQYEQERTYITNAVNNSNLSFEPFQLSFSKSSQNLLAVVGISQLGFFVLANQGKVQRFMQSDIKCPEPISKFEWIGRHRTSVFALSFGSNIRIGSITEDFKVKAGSKLKIQIDKIVKDFQISVQTHILSIFVIDQDGALYKADFDHRDSCTFSIQDKKVQLPNLGQLTSLILVGRKVLVCNTTGKLNLIKNQAKGAQLSIIQTYDIEQALKNCSQCKIKGTFYMSYPKLIHYNQNVISIGCILRRAGSESKKKGGVLAILRISGSNNDLDIIVLSDDESVQFFDLFEIGENNYSLVAVEETGNVWMAPYFVSAQLLQQREESRIPITQESVIPCNKVIKLQRLLSLVKFCDPRRCDTFKEIKDGKDITSAYSIIVDHPLKISFRANNPHKYFITGFSIKVQGAGQFSIQTYDDIRKCLVEKEREIQVGFTLKETLQYFVLDDEFLLPYKTDLSCISGKSIKIYGIQFSQQSVYRKAYAQLHRLVTIHFLYDDKNLVHYLQNQQKKQLPTLSLLEFQKLKTQYRYSQKDFTLLMKLQLLRVSSNDGIKKEDIEDMIGFVRNSLFNKCQRRQFLEKSCLKLLRQLCSLYQSQNLSSLGKPYQIRTLIDFYNFQRYFQSWNSSRQLSSFENLLSFLYSLIFKRITNLYLIIQLHPNLIYQLTFFYKNALHSLKHSSQHADQAQLAKLISICPSYVAIICQYYQTLKNDSTQGQMVDQNKYNKSAQKMVLDLLQEVFCATKKELYRQIFVCPELYLQRMYLTDKKPIALSTGIDIFRVEHMQGQHGDHASRKASLIPQQADQSDEQEIQLEQQSNRQMLEQQDREMPSQQSMQQSSQLVSSEVQKIIPKAIQKLSAYLNGYSLNSKTLHFTYYQFNFEIATALFKIPDYMTKQNAVFYMGFLFNLLRIIQFNTQPVRDNAYLVNLFRAILEALPNAKYSLLYLVLNYFFQPVYGEKDGNGVRQIKKPRSKLAKYFINFVINQGIRIEEIMNSLKVETVNKMVSMTEVMKFVSFQLENHLYALKLLGNLYILLRIQELPELKNSPSKTLKQLILRTVVQHNLRVFKNIMLMQGWAGELQRAKVKVGFDTLRQKPTEGVKLLYECAIKNKQVFVDMLSERNELIGQLEAILGDQQTKDNLLLQMLNIYYESC